MIETLTPDQEKQIPVYFDRWLNMPTKPMDKEIAFSAIERLYKNMGEEKPKIIIGQSPLQTALMVFVCSKLEPLKSNKEQLGSQMESQLRSQLWSQMGKINKNWYLVTGWEPFCSWADYSKSIGVKFDDDKFNLLTEFAKEVSFIIPYKGICFISEKPVEINWKNKLLHKDGGPSVKWADGYSMFNLNGVKVPEYLAVTESGKLELDWFNKQENADVRAEFIRKYGVDRMKSLGRKIDSHEKYNNVWWTKSKYELIDMSAIFKTVKYAPFLGMVNMTTGTYHLEGVEPKCKTIGDAMRFRCGEEVEIAGIK